LKAAGVDVLFMPDEKAIYPEPQTFVVEPSDLQYILEGAHRPGHFRGVATVVLKLFNLVMPHAAIFGKKDYQQYLVLRDMVKQFALPIEIIPAETVRARIVRGRCWCCTTCSTSIPARRRNSSKTTCARPARSRERSSSTSRK